MLDGSSTRVVLRSLVAHVLECATVDDEDDFHDLGGDSLALLQLLDAVREVFGVELPVERLAAERVTVSTIEALLDEVRSAPPVPHRLDHYRTEGDRPALLIVDPGLDLMRHLLPLLPSDQPVFGLPGPDALEAGAGSVEAVAAMSIRMLRAEVPEGPCMLTGHSFRGLLAYEMALQLTRSGGTVERVVLLDAIEPSHRWLAPGAPVSIHLRRAARLGWRRAPGALRAVARARRDGRRSGAPLEPIPPIRLAAARYAPGPRSGPTWVLATAAMAAEAGNDALGWSPLATDLQVRRIPGDHATMLQEPWVAELAEALVRSLI